MHRSLWRSTARVVFAAALTLGCANRPEAAEFLVTNTNNTGPGSLRAAIQAANSNIGADTIHFNIPGAPPHTIAILSALPTITDPVRIEADYKNFTDPRLIELDGSNGDPDASGLDIAVGNCVIRGLAIGGFGTHGIVIEGFGQSAIQGNFLGTDANGNVRLNASAGVALLNSSQNLIGGTGSADGNLIPANGTGILIIGESSISNVVQGNWVGPDIKGGPSLGNVQNGVLIYDSPLNTIGGTLPGARNVISGNGQSGIYIFGPNAQSNWVAGNYIGLNPAGLTSVSNTTDGVTIINGSANMIGGTQAGAGNVISGNMERGVYLGGTASGNILAGNLIGLNATGKASVANGFSGVALDNVVSNQIGGTVPLARNIISGNSQSGVLINGPTATGNLVEGNYIGTDLSGLLSVSNAFNGISILGSAGNIIGSPNTRNVISGNGESGVFIADDGATNNLVQGNLIGCDATGTKALSNSFAGVRLEMDRNRIGQGNIISGNGHSGIEIFHANDNLIQGNLIGLNIQGNAALGNDGGVAISGGVGNLIGGTSFLAGNVISGNDNSGIFLVDSDTSGNIVQGNFIGTELHGTNSVPNNGDGISIFGASANLIGGPNTNVIGGTNTAARNIIAANLQDGILITQASASNNVVQGNFIGTGLYSGTLANRTYGIELDQGASHNVIGGTLPAANTIAFGQTQDAAGVRIHSGIGNTIRFNSIVSFLFPLPPFFQTSIPSSGLAIDLGPAGPTPNDSGDGDDGANGLQNFPGLTSLISGPGTTNTAVNGTLNSKPLQTFTLDFYSSPVTNQNGYAEARTWIDSLQVTTPASGNTAFFAALAPTTPGNFIAATATDAEGNTSELSPPALVTEKDSDGDGMPDNWEITHGLDPNNPNDASQDPDHDGLTNLQEFLAGTDPFDPTSTLRLDVELLTSGRAVLTLQTKSLHYYQIEFQDDLGTGWVALGNLVGDGSRQLFEISAPSRHRFYRVVVLR